MNYLLVLATALVASIRFETLWTLAWYFAVFSISVLAMGAFFVAVSMASTFLACGVMLWASVR